MSIMSTTVEGQNSGTPFLLIIPEGARARVGPGPGSGSGPGPEMAAAQRAAATNGPGPDPDPGPGPEIFQLSGRPRYSVPDKFS